MQNKTTINRVVVVVLDFHIVNVCEAISPYALYFDGV